MAAYGKVDFFILTDSKARKAGTKIKLVRRENSYGKRRESRNKVHNLGHLLSRGGGLAEGFSCTNKPF